jgi:hypothetical protein
MLLYLWFRTHREHQDKNDPPTMNPYVTTLPYLQVYTAFHFVLFPFKETTNWKRHCTALHSFPFAESSPSNPKSKGPWFRFILHVTSTPLHLKESSRHHLLQYERDGSTIHVGLFNRAETTFLLSLQKRGLNLRYMWCLWPRGWIVGRDITKVKCATGWAPQASGGSVPGFLTLSFDGSEWLAVCPRRLPHSGPHRRSRSSRHKVLSRPRAVQ